MRHFLQAILTYQLLRVLSAARDRIAPHVNAAALPPGHFNAECARSASSRPFNAQNGLDRRSLGLAAGRSSVEWPGSAIHTFHIKTAWRKRISVGGAPHALLKRDALIHFTPKDFDPRTE